MTTTKTLPEGIDPWPIARRLFAEGKRWADIKRVTGLSYDTLKRKLVPEYAERRAERVRRRRMRKRGESVPALVESRVHPSGPKGPSREDIAKALATIPPDDRSLTARIMGDPLPGRSALDRMRGQ